MNIDHLKYAVEIAKTKSISQAAENLYMGQPNLSRAIKELEDSLGIIIFNRTPKGITTTPEGDEFLHNARRIIRQVDKMEEFYRTNRTCQRFSVSVPRATYISEAFAEFTAHLSTEDPADIYYKETNSMRTLNNVVKEEFNLGIVRYQEAFEQYYELQFEEKKLVSEDIAEFSYYLLRSWHLILKSVMLIPMFPTCLRSM